MYVCMYVCMYGSHYLYLNVWAVEEAEGEGEGDAEEGAADQSKHMKLTNVCTTHFDHIISSAYVHFWLSLIQYIHVLAAIDGEAARVRE